MARHMTVRNTTPSVILLAGERARTSYREFIASGTPTTRGQRAYAARRFFKWAEKEGLLLGTIERHHITSFHRYLLDHHGHAVAIGSFLFIRNLFVHLVAAGAIDTNPASEAIMRSARPLQTIRTALTEEFGGDGECLINAMLVMISPLEILTFSPKAISRYTHLPLSWVETTAARLYDQGIWRHNESIRCEWLDSDDPGLEYVSLLLDGMVALGSVVRDDELRYSLADEESPKHLADQSVSVRTTIRETQHVTERETTQAIIVRG